MKTRTKSEPGTKTKPPSAVELGQADARLEALADELQDVKGRLAAITEERQSRERVEKALHYSNQLLESSREELRRMTARFEHRVEDEKKQIARDLHEQLGQSLIALKMGLTSLANLRPEDVALQSAANNLVALVDDTIESTRRISLGLRPFVIDHLGVAAAIESLLHEWSISTGIKHSFESQPDLINIDQAGSIAVYRIVQEALNNVARHSGASRVQVSLVLQGGCLHLEILDNGKGIDPELALAPDSLGLIGMRERASRLRGDLVIEKGKPRGTRVHARIPATSEARNRNTC